MKTKIIPFDLETAKKIQAGEIEGKIIYNSSEAKVLDFNLYFKGSAYICAETRGNSGLYTVTLFDKYGNDAEDTKCNAFYRLVLEIPDNDPQFKPFDKVLVRNEDHEAWSARLYDVWFAEIGLHGTQDNKEYKQCIQYEGNEHLVGTTDKPKED